MLRAVMVVAMLGLTGCGPMAAVSPVEAPGPAVPVAPYRVLQEDPTPQPLPGTPYARQRCHVRVYLPCLRQGFSDRYCSRRWGTCVRYFSGL